ncbi:MAG: hypothetical protein QE279_03960 [Rhodoferax sp.]|jgi:hypothetical protein|nr:hypothetical protein [Rhodoferax sp.]
MSIRQLNASYVPEEDRVLLRFTTDTQEEYRLWLTRAVVGALLEQSEGLVIKSLEGNHSVHQAKAVAQFRQQTLQQTVSYTQFVGAARFPLGAEPSLVKAVQTQFGTQGAEVVFHLARGQNLSLRLNDDLVDKLQLLMLKMNDAAHWVLRLADAVKPSASSSLQGAKAESSGVTELSEPGNPPPKVLH